MILIAVAGGVKAPQGFGGGRTRPQQVSRTTDRTSYHERSIYSCWIQGAFHAVWSYGSGIVDPVWWFLFSCPAYSRSGSSSKSSTHVPLDPRLYVNTVSLSERNHTQIFHELCRMHLSLLWYAEYKARANHIRFRSSSRTCSSQTSRKSVLWNSLWRDLSSILEKVPVQVKPHGLVSEKVEVTV
jgi:hypothetical protein